MDVVTMVALHVRMAYPNLSYYVDDATGFFYKGLYTGWKCSYLCYGCSFPSKQITSAGGFQLWRFSCFLVSFELHHIFIFLDNSKMALDGFCISLPGR